MFLSSISNSLSNATSSIHILAQDSSWFSDFIHLYAIPTAITVGKNVALALLIFIVGRWAAGLVLSLIKKVLVKANVDDMLVSFIGNLAYWVLLTLVLIASAGALGIDTTSFTAIVAAAGLAVGFALKDSLSNFASGVMIIVFKPFKLGDFVDAGGKSGTVEEIHMFSTIMRTGDNVRMIIPNGAITSGTITNFSAKDTRRIDLVVGCGYGDDLKAVKEYLEATLAADDRILKDPAPVVAVSELGDSSVNFVVRPWVNSGDYWATRWDLTEAIKLGFDEKGFNIPYPTQDIHVHNAAG